MLSHAYHHILLVIWCLARIIQAQVDSLSTAVMPNSPTPSLTTTVNSQHSNTPEILVGPTNTPIPVQNGISKGAITGAVIGGVFASVLIAMAGFLIYRRRRIANAYAEGGVYAAIRIGVLSKKEIAEANLRANEPWVTASMDNLESPIKHLGVAEQAKRGHRQDEGEQEEWMRYEPILGPLNDQNSEGYGNGDGKNGLSPS
ncbi:hypothetical protein P154DRAFT_524510 [Amniculicola lignicola CBS 123094]|uniref:Uncharacterized protein n=1 Tax=Amniculicola lignicola CBS 123094 TaxID=1392246 RepID=A0A6A5W9G4_9PLEO|nr:hypothetical protein P154DRAFT_524510 [Amniculicola lignicola CBS 123094]